MSAYSSAWYERQSAAGGGRANVSITVGCRRDGRVSRCFWRNESVKLLHSEREIAWRVGFGRISGCLCGNVRCTHLGRMCAQTGFRGETFAADGAVKRPVFGPFHLGVVVPEMLLQIGQLYESSSALGQVTSVRSFSCGRKEKENIFFKTIPMYGVYIYILYNTKKNIVSYCATDCNSSIKCVGRKRKKRIRKKMPP